MVSRVGARKIVAVPQNLQVKRTVDKLSGQRLISSIVEAALSADTMG
jgi:hypothetical protein